MDSLELPSRAVQLEPSEGGYHEATVEGVEPGTRYLYELDPAIGPHGTVLRPDPASRFQPDGVHQPSAVVDPSFPWTDGSWRGLPLTDYVLYELHVGTYTTEGTFEAVIPHLDSLKRLGVTVIELMPVAQFPGSRNWGYDGVHPFAVQNSYGGLDGLRRLVDACHARGLAVALDVVYNHLGPEGNYLGEFGPYVTDRYHTPWGGAMNFDGPSNEGVRRFVIENALYWITDFHIDALRLDALHAIYDQSKEHILAELARTVQEAAGALKRQVCLIGESDLNDSTLIRPAAQGGYGLSAQWNDDFHHALHALLTGERTGYYEDFGGLEHLVKTLAEGYVYTGQPSAFRGRPHGNASADLPPHQFAVFSQNHDQIGNRMLGDRLSQLVSFEQLKLAAATVILSPFLPLLFMGEEYGEVAPFLYFVSHTDAQLVEAVRTGRREEFAAFGWRGELPDPQSEATFQQCRLNRQLAQAEPGRTLSAFYQELLRIRKTLPSAAASTREASRVHGDLATRVVCVRRGQTPREVLLVLSMSETAASATLPLSEGRWRKTLDSSEPRWRGPGSAVPEQLEGKTTSSFMLPPWTVLLFERTV